MLESLFNGFAGLKPLVFSCEHCEIFKNTYFEEKFKILTKFLLLTVNISSQGLVSALNSIVPLQGALQGLKSSVSDAQWQAPPLIEKKKKLAERLVVSFAVTRCQFLHHLQSFVVTRCRSLSLVVPLVVTRCITRLSLYKRSIFLSLKFFFLIFAFIFKDLFSLFFHGRNNFFAI